MRLTAHLRWIEQGTDRRKMRTWISGTLAIGMAFFMSSAVSARDCLDYEPAKVTIQGSMSLKPAYGPPGYGEDPERDAHEDYLAITLDAPACMKANSEPDTENVAESQIKAVQLVFRSGDEFKQAKQWIGKQVSVTGGLFHEFTGHHHTTVLMNVRELGQAANLDNLSH
jgi:hypothetical protein